MAVSHTKRPGFMVALSGGEGVGKTTQIVRLAQWLRDQGREVVTTREPGGSPSAEQIRALLVTGEVDRFSGESEVLLFGAARVEHLRQTIIPALDEGKIVLCDRFYADTWAIQHFARGLSADLVQSVHRLACGDFMPDMQLLLKMDSSAGLERSSKRLSQQGSTEGRFERLGSEFHARVAQGFVDYAAHHPAVWIDASGSVDEVHDRIVTCVAGRLGIERQRAGNQVV